MKPVLQALVLADHVYQDKATRKCVVAGTFNHVFIKTIELKQVEAADGQKRTLFPGGAQVGSPTAYISLTDYQGEDEFALRYVDLQNLEVLLKTEFRIGCKDPIQTIEFFVPLPGLPTPHPGAYALELLWNDEPLGSWRVNVAAQEGLLGSPSQE